MKRFKMLVHPNGKVEAVKQGWSWPGFCFSHFWALYNRMWLLGFGLLFVNMFLGGFVEVLRQSGLAEATLVIDVLWFGGTIGLCVAFGLKGNEWREAKLYARGFRMGSEIRAPSSSAATILLMAKQPTGG